MQATMKNKSILLVVRSLRLGGMERMTVNLANAFHRMGYDTHILLFKNRVEIQPDAGISVHIVDFDRWFRLSGIGIIYELITRGIISRFNRRSRLIFRSFWFSRLFSLWLKRLEFKIGNRFTLMVARGFGSFEGLSGFRDPRMLRIIVNELWMKKPGWADKIFFKGSFTSAPVLFNSQQVLDNFVSIGKKLALDNLRPKLIRNPTDSEAIRKKACEDIDIKGPFILNVGRLEHAKNQQLLLKAFARIHRNIPHQLVIIGDGSQRDKLHELAQELGVSQRVIFTGTLTNPYPWMVRADLFVLSSLHEGLPNVVIESLVCGTPVVVTRGKGGAVELMQGELRNFIAEMEPASLANKIEQSLHSPPKIDPDFVASFDMYQVAEQILKLK